MVVNHRYPFWTHMLSGHWISALLTKGATSISEAGMTPRFVAFVFDALRPFSIVEFVREEMEVLK